MNKEIEVKYNRNMDVELTVDAKLGVLSAFIDDNHRDEQKCAREYSETHRHRYLPTYT